MIVRKTDGRVVVCNDTPALVQLALQENPGAFAFIWKALGNMLDKLAPTDEEKLQQLGLDQWQPFESDL